MINEMPFRLWNPEARKMLYCYEAMEYLLKTRSSREDLVLSYHCGTYDRKGKKIYSGDILVKVGEKSTQADDSFIFIDFTNHNESGFCFTIELFKFGSDVGYFFLQDVLPDYIEDNYVRVANIFDDNEADNSLTWRQIAEKIDKNSYKDFGLEFDIDISTED